MKNIITISSLLLWLCSTAQNNFEYKTSPLQKLAPVCVDISKINQDFFSYIQSLEAPKPGGEEYNEYLEGIKKNIKPLPNPPEKSMYKSGIPAPVKLANFEGNRYPSGIPNDNDMAISDSGIIVSVVNQTVSVFDTTGVMLKTWSFSAFTDTLKLTQNKYDGRVLYDPERNRFVVALLNDIHAKNSYCIMAFSATSNPLGKWNIYKIYGNPLNDRSWVDYPIISLTKKELFLTLNGVRDSAASWQTGFKQSYIWQINKDSGYEGKNLLLKHYYGINYGGKPIRNLCPVQGGMTLTNNENYFVSNRNFAASSDTFFLLKLEGLLSDTATKLTVNVLKSDKPYGVSPNASQTKKIKLQTNDSRVLDALVENGRIHIVGNSVSAMKLAGVFHGVISSYKNNPSLHLNILGDSLEFGYPSVAFAGNDTSSDDVVLLVNHSGVKFFPGYSAIFYSHGVYSNPHTVKSGTADINWLGSPERWGDYSGIQRMYKTADRIWMAGTYGYKKKIDIVTTIGAYGTWLSEVKIPMGFVGVNEVKKETHNPMIYPNPVMQYEEMKVEFTAEEKENITISIFDINGRLVKILMNTTTEEGKNLFGFNTKALNPGNYFINISSAKGRRILTKKFTVQ